MAFAHSIENLINTDIESIASTEGNDVDKSMDNGVQTVEVDVHSPATSKSYILEKFLNDSDRSVESNATFVKPPIPKPRKSKQNVASRHSDSGSHNTYQVPHSSKGVIPKINDDDNISNKTYSVDFEKKGSTRSSSNSSKTFTVENELSAKTSKKSHSVTSNEFNNDVRLEYVDEMKPKPRKRRLKQNAVQKSETKTIEESSLHLKYNVDSKISIVVHRTDKLLIDSIVVHPIVKIHLINSESGEYLKYSSNDTNNSCHILPVMTHAYHLQENRSFVPKWEETILINECVNSLANPRNNAIVLFEIIDFLTFANLNAQNDQFKHKTGWHRIAWAFLRPLGSNGTHYINQPVRLQLYYPRKTIKTVPSSHCEIFHWWQKSKLKKYPATIYLTVKETEPSDKEIETLRTSVKMMRKKVIREFVSGDSKEEDVNFNCVTEHIDKMKKLVIKDRWQKLQGNVCQLPNTEVTKLSTFDEGCFSLKFSHSGLFLAVSVLVKGSFSILVYDTEDFKEIYKFPGHQNIVYEISWSIDDKYLVTASADSTVCVWGFQQHNFMQILPHSSYIYTTSISSNYTIITAGYDCVVRIWKRNEEKFELTDELVKHKGYVTSSCFMKSAEILYTADAVGMVIEWKFENGWNLNREISIIDIKDTVINKIQLNKKEKSLLIHSRDSMLRLIDLKSLIIVNRYKGNNNNRVRMSSCFSTCGNYIFAGSEDGKVNIWSLTKSEIIGYYQPYNNKVPVQTMDFHPKTDTIAFGFYSKPLPVLLLKFTENPNTSLLKLRINEQEYITKLIENAHVGSRESIRAQDHTSALTRNNSIHFKNILEKLDSMPV